MIASVASASREPFLIPSSPSSPLTIDDSSGRDGDVVGILDTEFTRFTLDDRSLSLLLTFLRKFLHFHGLTKRSQNFDETNGFIDFRWLRPLLDFDDEEVVEVASPTVLLLFTF